jgi:hypothetical protein
MPRASTNGSRSNQGCEWTQTSFGGERHIVEQFYKWCELTVRGIPPEKQEFPSCGHIPTTRLFCFSLEARHAIGIVSERLGQDFQRDVTAKFGVPRPIHLAHATGANWREDLIRAEFGANT